jgi:tryptophanyl-tRNA synthetase
MKRVLSGIKPTGDAHLGSYLGAMKNWPLTQSSTSEVFFFIADLHALNARIEPQVLTSNSLDLVAWLLALGVDAETSPIFAQSQVSAHAELSWILNNYATMGELNRMTQYKDKALKNGPEGQLVALFDYPVLMAADILLYDADEVPVGDDQTQHVELTRKIAERFNNLYGETFKLPKFVAPSHGSRVMMLDNPTQKMSKSDAGEGCVYLLDDDDVIRRKFKRAMTDSLGTIGVSKDEQAGIYNLLEILSALSGRPLEAVLQEWQGKGYGELKDATGEAVVAELAPLKHRFASLRSDEGKLRHVLAQGRERAALVAEEKLKLTKQKLGLV